jgi:RNA polymerase sigma-70 factor (TIGR02943 family)
LSDTEPSPRSTPPDPARWVDEHGDYLYRLAFARTGRTDAAEDLVQDTLLAALRASHTYAGRSSERTWLSAILRNKVIDRLRRQGRAPFVDDAAGTEALLEGLYDRSGHWRSPPGAWGSDPAALLESREFWDAFEECRRALPDRFRDVLSLRLIDDVPAAEICQALDISASNLWTLLHRARVRLWQCLDRKGLAPFGGTRKS